jgi:hypothetical protein
VVIGSRAMKKIAVGFAVASLFVVFASCKPSAGGECKENATSCDTPTSRFACIANRYVLETCKGAKGCKEEKGTTVCDSSKGDLGDPCAQANVTVCGTDGKTQYKCVEGKLAFVSRCSKDGCSVDDNGAGHCNDPFAKVGDTCKNDSTKTERGNGACNEDFKSELRCKDGKFALTEYCRGAEGCVPLTTGPWCDRSVANQGDDCDPDKEEFARSCDNSKENIFTCVNHKLTRQVHCGGEGKCYVRQYGQDGFSHYQAECDQSLAKAGEECVKEGQPACSDDLKDRLMCSNGKFGLDTACKKGCMIHAPDGTPFQCAENAAKAISDTLPKKK